MTCDLNAEGTGEGARKSVWGKEQTVSRDHTHSAGFVESAGESNLRGGVRRDAARGARTQSGQAWLDVLQSLSLPQKPGRDAEEASEGMCVRVGDEGAAPERSLKPHTRRKEAETQTGPLSGCPTEQPRPSHSPRTTCRSNQPHPGRAGSLTGLWSPLSSAVQ